MMRRHLVGLVFCACALLAGVSAAAALDIDDIRSLLENNVPEQIIINMVATDGTVAVTPDAAESLRGLGASDSLIAALTASETAEYAQPTVVTSTETYATETYTETVEPPVVITDTVLAGPVEGSPVSPVSVTSIGAFPPRYDKEGWLSISNHDWMPYFIAINQADKRIFISRSPNGGMVVDSGQNVAVNLRKETYKMYGDSGNKLEIKVRENETTRLSLNPFGVVGNSGLTGVAVDRDRVRSEILFANYAPPPAVVVQPAPVYVAPPPPPPVYLRPHHRGGVHFRYRR